MKKMMMLAAMALMTAVASAVTLTWDKTYTGLTGAQKYDDLGLAEGGVATVAAAITYGTNITGGTLLSVSMGGNDMVSVAYNSASQKYVLVASGFDSNLGNGEHTTSVGITAGETDYISLHFNRTLERTDTGAAGRVMSVDLYINGVLQASIDSSTYQGSTWPGAYTHDGTIDTVSVGGRNGTGDAYTGDRTLDLYYANEGYTAAAVYATIVPEPTALALLALGVAGLALKRKVA